jgi:hypothetical protein
MGEAGLEGATEPGAGPHLFHVLAHALFAWLLLISLAVQLRHPELKFAAAVFALAAMITYSVGTLVAGIFDPLEVVAIVLLAAALWLSPGRENAKATPLHRRALLASIPIIAGGFVVAVVEAGRQLSGMSTDQHAEFGHYGLVAAMAVIVILASLIGSSALAGPAVGGRFGRGRPRLHRRRLNLLCGPDVELGDGLGGRSGCRRADLRPGSNDAAIQIRCHDRGRYPFPGTAPWGQ